MHVSIHPVRKGITIFKILIDLFWYHRLALHDKTMQYQIYMLKHIHLKHLTFVCTMACQSIPKIRQKRESDFHCGPYILTASHSEAQNPKMIDLWNLKLTNIRCIKTIKIWRRNIKYFKIHLECHKIKSNSHQAIMLLNLKNVLLQPF